MIGNLPRTVNESRLSARGTAIFTHSSCQGEGSPQYLNAVLSDQRIVGDEGCVFFERLRDQRMLFSLHRKKVCRTANSLVGSRIVATEKFHEIVWHLKKIRHDLEHSFATTGNSSWLSGCAFLARGGKPVLASLEKFAPND